jgi:hypothetical protein
LAPVYEPGETPGGHAVSFGDLVSLTVFGIRRLLDETDGKLQLELPANSPTDLKLTLA